jgi:hypothetical protein
MYNDFRHTKLTDFKDDLVEAAIRYARIRVDWLMADNEKRREIDEARTRAHNALITACDILARSMKNAGESGDWRDELGNDRKRIGDFACLLHCILGLSAR